MSILISVAILNYRRSENVSIIIETLRQQTVPVKILVWDNSNEDRQIHGADMVVRSSINMYCWPRWMLLSQTDTEFGMTLDDDINLASSSGIENILDCLERLTHDTQIIGPEGVIIEPGQPYFPVAMDRVINTKEGRDKKTGQHIKCVVEDTAVDIIKGRSMALRTAAIRKLPMFSACTNMCDDIAVSALLANGRPCAHTVPAALSSVFFDLPSKNGPMALSARSDWKQIREEARQMYFPTFRSNNG